MKFKVVWTAAAQSMLADLWLAAPDRAAVTAASHRLDQRLAADPVREGESRGGTERLTFDAPLSVLFRIILDDYRVEVVSVGRSGR